MNLNVFPSFPVLLVDDEEPVLKSLSGVLKSGGISNIICTEDSSKVLEILSEQEIGVMLLDLTMPGLSGEELLPIIHLDYPDLPVIIITGNSEVSTAVECIKMGASDYLVKAVEKNKLIATVKRAIEIQELKRENSSLKKHLFSNKLERPEAFSEIITGNEKMRSILLYVEAISKTAKPVLITGETGVGKELIARAIHTLSKRQTDIFLPVNVAGFDDNMFSDNLFGHRKGAFTGAEQVRKGLIERAAGGTLFLDEIGDLSHASQVKLLRLIETGEYFPLGSDVAKKSEARIIVATNRDINKAVEFGDFRKDLFYRLHTHQVHLPPLGERMDDLPLLIEHFLEKASQELGKKKPNPPPELFTLLGVYNFPGNVRELETMIFDAVSRYPDGKTRRSGTLSLEVFKRAIGQENIRSSPKIQDKLFISFSERLPTIKQATELLINEALKRSKGTQTIAARILGISQQALNKRLSRRNGETS